MSLNTKVLILENAGLPCSSEYLTVPSFKDTLPCRKSVNNVFPAPLGPTTAQLSPSSISQNKGSLNLNSGNLATAFSKTIFITPTKEGIRHPVCGYPFH